MKTASKIFWSTLLVALSLAMPAQAVPQLLGYQGRLVNADGTADSKVQKFRFSVWDLETGGVKKWEETQDIGLTNGFYATYLGQVTAFSASLFDGSDRYLQVSLIDAANNEEILTPRQRVGSVAYALRAGMAQSVAGGGTVDATAVTVNGQPALTSVSATAPITGGGTATSPLALGPCASGEILKWSGTAWACSVDLNGSGTVTAVNVNAPLMSSGGTAPTLSITTAGTAGSGYLTSTDWNTFNNKVGSVAGSAPIVSSGGSAPAISILPASPTAPGSMSAADKAKLDGITTVVASVGAAGPVASSGGANPVISMSKATSAVDGYLAALDWTTFNNKLDVVSHDASLAGTGTAASPLGLKACLGGQILKWNGTTNVWECSADANSGGTVTSVATGAGLLGGPITAAGTVSIDAAVIPRLGVANTFTTGGQTIQAGQAANKGLLVQGAAGQTANLQEWQNNLGTPVASVSALGDISGLSVTGSGSGLTGLNASSLASGTVPLARLTGITSTQLAPAAGITNAQLASSSLTVTAGTGLTGGGAVSLGGTVTLGIGTVPVANGGTGAITAPAALANLGGASLSAANTFTTGAQTIQTGLAANRGLLVQGAASQTANLQEWQNSAGAALASVSSAGVISGAGFAGSGAGLIGLNASSLASGTVSSAVVSGAYPGVTGVGTITSGTWQGAAIGAAYGGTGINSSTAGAGSILRTTAVGTWGPLAPGANGQVLTVSAGLPAWANPATSGTVTSVGTGLGLSGGPITTAGSLAIDPLVVPQLGAANTFTAGAQTIQTGLAANKGLLVQGAAAQTGNLQEWQNNVGTAVASVSAFGDISGLTFTGSGSGLSNLNASNLASGTVPLARLSGITSAQLSPTAGITGSQLAAAAGITNAQLANSTVTVTPGVGLTGGGVAPLGGAVTLGIGTVPIANGGTGATTAPAALTNLGGASLSAANTFTTGAQTIQTGAAVNKGLLVQGAASQTANLQEWQNSAGTALASVSSAGVMSGTGFAGSGAGLTALNGSNVASGLVGAAFGGTGVNTSAAAAGSILKTTGIGTWATLPPGINGQILTVSAGSPSWANPATSGTVTSVGTGLGLSGGPITTAGSLAIDPLVVPQLGAANTFTAGAQTIQTGAATNKGLLVQGAAAQTGNLQEWQNNLGTAVASVSAFGDISGLTFSGSGSGLTSLNASNLSSGTVPLARLTGLTTAQLSATAGITNAQLANSSITVTPGAPLTGGGVAALGGAVTIGLGTVPIANGGTGATTAPAALTNLGGASLTAANTFTTGAQTIQTGAAANKGLLVQGAASQTANLQEWQNNLGTVLASVDSAGGFTGASLAVTGAATIGGTLTSTGNGTIGGVGIGTVAAGYFGDTTNLAARFSGAAGDFYVQSSSGVSTYARFGAGIGGGAIYGNLSVSGNITAANLNSTAAVNVGGNLSVTGSSVFTGDVSGVPRGRNLINWTSTTSKWTVIGASTPAIALNTADVIEGDSSFDFTIPALGSGSTLTYGDFIPVDPNRRYEGRISTKLVSGAGNFFAGYVAYDAAKTILVGNGGTFGYFLASNQVLVAGTWTHFRAQVTGEGVAINQFPVGTRFIKPLIIVNYMNVGTTRVDSLEIYEVDMHRESGRTGTYSQNGCAPGPTISFATPFSAPPQVRVTWETLTVAAYCYLYGQATTTSFRVDCCTGGPGTGIVSWVAEGP